MSSGISGCAISDTDTDGDSTPKHIGGCPHDATKTKTSHVTCGCSVPDTNIHQDGTPNHCSDCSNSDPSILSICEERIHNTPHLNCEGCAGEY